MPWAVSLPERKKRLHSMGVKLMETMPEMRMAAQMVTANSRKRRARMPDRKSTRLNSSYLGISYAVFCLEKKEDPSSFQESVSQSSEMNYEELQRYIGYLEQRGGNLVLLSVQVVFFLMMRQPPRFTPFPTPPLSD